MKLDAPKLGPVVRDLNLPLCCDRQPYAQRDHTKPIPRVRIFCAMCGVGTVWAGSDEGAVTLWRLGQTKAPSPVWRDFE